MNTVVKPGFFIAILFIGLAKLPLGESRIYHKPALAKSENINKISVMNNILTLSLAICYRSILNIFLQRCQIRKT